jgi:2-keto-4-pentenoate hydratase
MATDLAAIAGRLHAARMAGDYCPEWLPGALDLDGALAVQLMLLDRAIAAGERLGGWKVGLTSPRARGALGADVRPFGYVLERDIFASGATLPTASISRPSIEPELCFTFARPLEGLNADRDAARAAVSTVSPGFEINERRAGSARPDLPAMVTDRLTQYGIVYGESADPRTLDVNGIRCELKRNGDTVYTGVSRDELDDHFGSLARLAAGLAAHGRRIEAGQRVITGAFARYDAAPGDHWRADYSGAGSVEVSFA